MPRKSKGTVMNWSLKGRPMSEVVAEVKKQAEHLQPWVGRLIWWDRFSEVPGSDPEPFKHWIDRRGDPEVDPVELAKALIACGYTEKYACLRAGAVKWDTGPRPTSSARHAPEDVVFPIQFGSNVYLHKVKKADTFIYEVRIPGQGRRGSRADYFEGVDLAMDVAKKEKDLVR